MAWHGVNVAGPWSRSRTGGGDYPDPDPCMHQSEVVGVGLLSLSESCRAMVGLQDILGREERLSFLAACRMSEGPHPHRRHSNKKFSGLHRLYESAVYTKVW